MYSLTEIYVYFHVYLSCVSGKTSSSSFSVVPGLPPFILPRVRGVYRASVHPSPDGAQGHDRHQKDVNIRAYPYLRGTRDVSMSISAFYQRQLR